MTPEEAKQFGQYLAKVRKTRGLTLRAVAEAAGMTAASVLHLERGEYEAPRIPKLQGLARALEIPVEELFTRAGYVMPEQLPELVPYLRAKYDLPPRAVSELGKLFQEIQARESDRSAAKGSVKKTGGHRGSRSR